MSSLSHVATSIHLHPVIYQERPCRVLHGDVACKTNSAALDPMETLERRDGFSLIHVRSPNNMIIIIARSRNLLLQEVRVSTFH